MTAAAFDRRVEQIESGGRLSPDDVHELSAAADILPLGMLADTLRRRLHGTRATYVRVAPVAFEGPLDAGVPANAGEVLVTGTPDTLEAAAAFLPRVKSMAGDRTVTAFTWQDVERLAAASAKGVDEVLSSLRHEGLDGFAELPLDTLADPEAAIGQLRDAGFSRLRLTVDAPGAGPALWLRAAALQARFGCIHVLSPLASRQRMSRPTTGYEDVKSVAAARLAAPDIPVIQVDWQRYGPKLAQVALTFGADDVWGISASDEAPEGRRRAALEEIRRNIEAAGFQPAERDGRFAIRA